MNLKLVGRTSLLYTVNAAGVFEAAANAPVNYGLLFTAHMTRRKAQLTC